MPDIFLKCINFVHPIAFATYRMVKVRPQVLSLILLGLSVALDIWGYLTNPLVSFPAWIFSVTIHAAFITWINIAVMRWLNRCGEELANGGMPTLNARILRLRSATSYYFALGLLSLTLALLVWQEYGWMQPTENLLDLLSDTLAFVFIVPPPRKSLRDRIREKVESIVPSMTPAPAPIGATS